MLRERRQHFPVRLNCQVLDIDTGHVERRALGRERSAVHALHTIPINETGDFHNRVGRQVRNQAVPLFYPIFNLVFAASGSARSILLPWKIRQVALGFKGRHTA
jgi:hypothetical protein